MNTATSIPAVYCLIEGHSKLVIIKEVATCPGTWYLCKPLEMQKVGDRAKLFSLGNPVFHGEVPLGIIGGQYELELY